MSDKHGIEDYTFEELVDEYCKSAKAANLLEKDKKAFKEALQKRRAGSDMLYGDMFSIKITERAGPKAVSRSLLKNLHGLTDEQIDACYVSGEPYEVFNVVQNKDN